MQTIYSGLYTRAVSLGINISTSGWILENTPFPHISIEQIASVPTQDNSLVSRIEESRYQFSIHTLSFTDTQDYIELLKTNLAFGELELDYRRFTSMQYDNHMYREVDAGIYHGLITFNILTEKDYSQNQHRIVSTRFYDGLKTINDNSLKVVMTMTEQLENTELPYISVGNIRSTSTDAHSQGILNSDNFSFQIFDKDLFHLEETIEKIHNNYDYCLIDIQQKKNLTVQWLMNTITEIEPGIWRARMDYSAINEDLINV